MGQAGPGWVLWQIMSFSLKRTLAAFTRLCGIPWDGWNECDGVMRGLAVRRRRRDEGVCPSWQWCACWFFFLLPLLYPSLVSFLFRLFSCLPVLLCPTPSPKVHLVPLVALKTRSHWIPWTNYGDTNTGSHGFKSVFLCTNTHTHTHRYVPWEREFFWKGKLIGSTGKALLMISEQRNLHMLAFI